MTDPTAPPVLFAHYHRCVLTLEKGMVKRVFPRGAVHAYQVACPWCGFLTMHFGGAEFFTEEGETTSWGPKIPGGPALAFVHPKLVATTEALVCPACRVGSRVVAGRWERGDLPSAE